jgi:glutathione synthase/RimK-type ligase-like ATP-grasp enzyme
MILLWGLPEDPSLAAVYKELLLLDSPVVFLNQRETQNLEMELLIDSHISGKIRTKDQEIGLNSIDALYLRPYDMHAVPEFNILSESNTDSTHADYFEDCMFIYSELTSSLVINRPAAMASNTSKPYQSMQIVSAGFDIPDTLITTDAAAVLEYWTKYGTIIYKSISGIRSNVSRFTSRHIERLNNIAWCPTQFQEYIPGDDYRIHIVGNSVFACQIISEADDYRYPENGLSVEMHTCSLPGYVEKRCRKLVAAMGLVVAGVDLRNNPDGRWICFEVNPSPDFTYYYETVSNRVAESIARLLASAK